MIPLAAALVVLVIAVKVAGEALELGGLGMFAALVVGMAALIAADWMVLRRGGR